MNYFGIEGGTKTADWADTGPEGRAVAEGFITPYTPIHTMGSGTVTVKGWLVVWGVAPCLRQRLGTDMGDGMGINFIIYVITLIIAPTLCEGILPARRQRRGSSSCGAFVMDVVMDCEAVSMMTMIKWAHWIRWVIAGLRRNGPGRSRGMRRTCRATTRIKGEGHNVVKKTVRESGGTLGTGSKVAMVRTPPR